MHGQDPDGSGQVGRGTSLVAALPRCATLTFGHTVHCFQVNGHRYPSTYKLFDIVAYMKYLRMEAIFLMPRGGGRALPPPAPHHRTQGGSHVTETENHDDPRENFRQPGEREAVAWPRHTRGARGRNPVKGRGRPEC